jgi:hypothetical protein
MLASRIRIIVLATLLTVLLFTSPRVEGGRCLGADRARITRIFEYTSYWFNEGLKYCAAGLQTLAANFKPAVFHASMSLLQLDARFTVDRLATGEDATALSSLFDRAQRLLGNGPRAQMTLRKLRAIVAKTSGTFIVCRAIRQKNIKACAVLERFELTSVCESMVITNTVMVQNDCSMELINEISAALNEKPKSIQTFCHAVRDQKPSLCNIEIDSRPFAQAMCRSQAGEGEQACNNLILGPEKINDCRNTLLIRDVMAGKKHLNALPQQVIERELLLPTLLAINSDLSCERLALDTYRKQIQKQNLFTPGL